ncbi:MAG: phage terminase large subunit [Planctomycetia bacterium]|nr:phage terminase large subunit [Planctomycetia bacterium]
MSSQPSIHTEFLTGIEPTVVVRPCSWHLLDQVFSSPMNTNAEPPASPDDDLTLLEWGRKYLSDHFTRPPSEMHLWLAEQLDLFREARGSRLNVIGPRGSAKSTLATLGYVLRAATAGWERYIWIISDTTEQAQSHLENVRAELTENRLLRRNYTVAARRGKLWRKMALALRNGVTIECFGTGQRIRGRRRGATRPTLIVCDDLQNDQHMDSALQRDRSRRWFHGTLLQAGTSRTNVVNLATALHFDALALQLARTPGWLSKRFASIQQWPANTQLWQQWEAIYSDLENPDSRAAARAFYELHREEMDAGAVVLWPQEEDLYALMMKRMESGEGAFEREKQSSPVDPERCEWPATYFAGDLWFDAWPESLLVKTMALDPSKGNDARRGDYSAYAILGVDRQGIHYVEADLARRPTPQMVSDGVRLLRHFRPDIFGIEANQFQELLAPLFLFELQEAGLQAVSPCLVTNDVNKGVRIRRLSPYLSMRRLRFKNNSPSTKMLVDQLRQFPHADHDDGPDALEMALRMALELQRGRVPDDGLGDRLILDM